MKEIKSTKDYKKFKTLIGNRNVTEVRVNKIIKSINKVGYISNPIIVNEKMEVIDGQGRLEALKRLGLPVEYIVQKDLGINECISMNLNQTNWTLMNYIVSFASRKNENYIRLLELSRKYSEFTLNGIATALFGISKFHSPTLASGDLIVSEELIEIAKSRMDYVRQVDETIARMQVNRGVLRQGLLYMSMFEEIDKESFIEQFKKNGLLLKPFHTIRECMQSIEDLYNYGRSKRVYIYTLYDKIARENERKGIDKIMKEKLHINKKSNEIELKSPEELSFAIKNFISKDN